MGLIFEIIIYPLQLPQEIKNENDLRYDIIEIIQNKLLSLVQLAESKELVRVIDDFIVEVNWEHNTISYEFGEWDEIFSHLCTHWFIYSLHLAKDEIAQIARKYSFKIIDHISFEEISFKSISPIMHLNHNLWIVYNNDHENISLFNGTETYTIQQFSSKEQAYISQIYQSQLCHCELCLKYSLFKDKLVQYVVK